MKRPGFRYLFENSLPVQPPQSVGVTLSSEDVDVLKVILDDYLQEQWEKTGPGRGSNTTITPEEQTWIQRIESIMKKIDPSYTGVNNEQEVE